VETPLSHFAHLDVIFPDVETSARLYEEKFCMPIKDEVQP
jgi:catechol 2,3-dioxygenase